MLTTNYGSSSLTRLLGDGRGGFSGVKSLAAGAGPYGLAAGDFDGDGFADVAVTDSRSGDLLVFAGDGRGGVREPSKVTAGGRPRGLVVADFDRDGRPDLAVADSTGRVIVLINDCGAAAGAGGGRGGSGAVSKTLQAGQWGGQGARLDVKAAGASIEFDCAHGELEGPLTLDASGRFEARGTFEAEKGGPVGQVSAAREGSSKAKAGGRPALYKGRVGGDTLTLDVSLADAGEVLGTFRLSRGSAGRLRKCL